MISSPRGEPIADTKESWKHHAYLLGDLIIEQKEIISQLKMRVNKLEQRVNRNLR
jgi:hypothetical protein